MYKYFLSPLAYLWWSSASNVFSEQRKNELILVLMCCHHSYVHVLNGNFLAEQKVWYASKPCLKSFCLFSVYLLIAWEIVLIADMWLCREYMFWWETAKRCLECCAVLKLIDSSVFVTRSDVGFWGFSDILTF